MVTKNINEEASLWFNDIRINANKVNGMPSGSISANGGFILTSNCLLIESIGISEDVTTFLGAVATKLSLDPAVVYQAICDSLEDAYNASLPVEPPAE